MAKVMALDWDEWSDMLHILMEGELAVLSNHIR